MNEDFEGYSNEIDYTFGYYPWLSPAHLRLVCLNHSISFPPHRPLRYLELGCGNGVSLNIHAAACPGEYWGTDINASHVNFSKRLAKTAASGVRALDRPFSDLLNYPGLPDFDVIAIHGVWSYISEANRNAILNLLGQKLVEGGLFYVSYNAMPGSSGIIPLQHILRLYSERGGDEAAVVDRLEAGIAFVSELEKAGSGFFSSIPKASERLAEIKNQNPTYLVHEYLHEFWHVPSFAQTARSLAEIGLRFVASANPLDHYEDLSIDQQGSAILASLEDPFLRETTRDFLRDQQFRQDVFIKDKGQDLQPQCTEVIEDLAVILGMPEVQIPTKIESKNRSISLSTAQFRCVLTALAAGGNRAKTVRELSEHCRRQLTGAEVARAVMILISLSIIYPVQRNVAIGDATIYCQKLNEEILRQTSMGKQLSALASPLTGSGIQMSRAQQLCLKAYRAGAKTPDEWARFAWNTIAGEGQDETDGDPRGAGERLLREALLFQLTLPIYCALGLADPNIG